MSPRMGGLGLRVGRFPRVSGDEPVIPDLKATGARFSPRERG